MYGGHYSKDVLTIPCGGGLWQFSNGTSLPTARQQETVFWKRMDVDTIRGSSEKSRCCFEVRLMTIQSGSAGRHEAIALYLYAYDTSDGGAFASVHGKNNNGSSSSNRLYSLELDVQSYERLRREETLLVDFSEFLCTVIWLLEQSSQDHTHEVIGPRHDIEGKENGASLDPSSTQPREKKRFRVVLHEQQGKLEFLECNAFRELSHLKLCVQPNSDKGTAKFLSFRLQEVLEENQRLQQKVDSLEHEGRQMYQELSGLQEKLSADTNQHSNETSTWKIQCDLLHSQIVNAKEQHDFLKEKLEAAEAAEAHATKALSAKNRDLTRANDEIQRLHSIIESFERTKISLEDVKSNSEKEIQRLQGLCDGYKSASDMADARVEDWKRMAMSHEAQATKRAQTIHIMENKISKLSQELSEARLASQDIEKRVHQREELMETQEQALQTAQSRVSDLQQHQRQLEQQLANRDKTLDDTQKKLEEANKKAQNSEKMIVWLNKQLTSIQLKSGSGAPCVKTPSPRPPTGNSLSHVAFRESPKAHAAHTHTHTHTHTTPRPTSRLAMSSTSAAPSAQEKDS